LHASNTALCSPKEELAYTTRLRRFGGLLPAGMDSESQDTENGFNVCRGLCCGM